MTIFEESVALNDVSYGRYSHMTGWTGLTCFDAGDRRRPSEMMLPAPSDLHYYCSYKWWSLLYRPALLTPATGIKIDQPAHLRPRSPPESVTHDHLTSLGILLL